MPQDKLFHAWVPLAQSFGFLYQSCRALMRGVEVNLVAGRAADRRRENCQSPVEIPRATQRAGGNQYRLAFPERRDQNRKISVLRQELQKQTVTIRPQQRNGRPQRCDRGRQRSEYGPRAERCVRHVDKTFHERRDPRSPAAPCSTRAQYQTHADASTPAVAALSPWL